MNKKIIFLQSKINVVKARIEQIKESDLFNETQKEILIEHNDAELMYYQSELAKQIEVVNPEIL